MEPDESGDLRNTTPDVAEFIIGCAFARPFAHPGQAGFSAEAVCAPAVEKKIRPRLTGPVSRGVLFKLICRAQNPPAAMRGGFLHWRAAK
jgi:hypothetical protein